MHRSLASVLFLALILPVACSSRTQADIPAPDAERPDASVVKSVDGGFAPRDGSSNQAPPCTRCARDWSSFPAIAEVEGATELWVVSDIHGDYAAFTKLLVAGRIIDAAPDSPKNVQWSAGHAALVVVGDLIDKGPDAPDVVRLVSALQTAAAVAGGRVVVTMGNHEAEFLADPLNSKAEASDGPCCNGRMKLLALVTDPTSVADALRDPRWRLPKLTKLRAGATRLAMAKLYADVGLPEALRRGLEEAHVKLGIVLEEPFLRRVGDDE